MFLSSSTQELRLRALFTLLPGTGSLNPLLPFARALTDAGHQVAFCSAPSFRSQVEAFGYEYFAAGLDWQASDPRYLQVLADAGGAELPPPVGLDRLAWVTEKLFIGGAARRLLPELIKVAKDWRANVLVRENLEFAGCVAAESLGLVHASVGAAANSALDLRAQLTAPLAKLRADVGLLPDPSGAMPYRYLHVCATPPSFDGAGAVFPPTAHFVRHTDRVVPAGPLPDWLDRLDDRPLVVASLGTVFHRTPGAYEAITAALATEPVNVAIALGPGQDPSRVYPVPSHFHVETHLPLLDLLERCDVLITHGGFNSVKEAMSRGVPMVAIPIASDQLYSAERCEALGLAESVPPDQRTPERIRDATRMVLADPVYRRRALEMAAEMADLPPIDSAITRLAALVAEHPKVDLRSRVGRHGRNKEAVPVRINST